MRAAAFGQDDPGFARCLPCVLEQEGVPGNDFDPHDPGGRTHEGIIQSEYNAYRLLKKLSVQSVWKASDAEVDEIYFMQYWLPWCPKMQPGVNLSYFDNAVNEGPARATALLQQALGFTGKDVDGHLGLVTIHAILTVSDVEKLITDYAKRRIDFYGRLANFLYFGRGWTRREQAIRDQSLAMWRTRNG